VNNATKVIALTARSLVAGRRFKRAAPEGDPAPEERAVLSHPQRRHGRRPLHDAAVESAINALEVHGLDRCLDHGLAGFKRYVALAVVARNIQRLGALLRRQEAERQRGPYRRAA